MEIQGWVKQQRKMYDCSQAGRCGPRRGGIQVPGCCHRGTLCSVFLWPSGPQTRACIRITYQANEITDGWAQRQSMAGWSLIPNRFPGDADVAGGLGATLWEPWFLVAARQAFHLCPRHALPSPQGSRLHFHLLCHRVGKRPLPS